MFHTLASAAGTRRSPRRNRRRAECHTGRFLNPSLLGDVPRWRSLGTIPVGSRAVHRSSQQSPLSRLYWVQVNVLVMHLARRFDVVHLAAQLGEASLGSDVVRGYASKTRPTLWPVVSHPAAEPIPSEGTLHGPFIVAPFCLSFGAHSTERGAADHRCMASHSRVSTVKPPVSSRKAAACPDPHSHTA